MAQAAVVGRPGAGKTLFVLRFAQWCGCRRLVVTVSTRPGAPGLRRELSPAEAVAQLVGLSPPTTRRLQSLELVHRSGKHLLAVELVDTVGLTDDVHPEPDLRRGMADSLAVALASRALLHLLDGPRVAQQPGQLLHPDGIDAQLARLGETRARYAALVNKLDLPGGARGLEEVRRLWPGRTVIGISALHGWGFERVRRFLLRSLP
ncbi:MAG TPA: hypothetical protein VIL11_03975 [Limnochordales bacterium]